MTVKRVVPRRIASLDVAATIEYYANKGGEALADRFATNLQEAIRAIGERPAAGSPRYGLMLEVAGLRTRSVRGFPYLLFYVEHDDYVDVWRILHAHRDIPSTLSDT